MRLNTWLVILAWATFAISRASSGESVDFSSQIRPLLQEHCGQCHGEKRQLAKLRLTSANDIREKIAAEPGLLVAGKPDESELYQRLVLPPDDKKRMPKQADPLSAETISLIRTWIEQGAVLADSEADDQESDSSAATKEEPLPDVPPAATEAIERLSARGAHVLPLFAGSSLLEVSYALREEPAQDADLQMLESVAEQLISLNLKGGHVTVEGFASLARFENLRKLHLELSSVTDESLKYVTGLRELEYLNLYGTEISDAGLQHLQGLSQLRNLYLWQTKASYDVAMSLADHISRLDVNLGHNHPVVVKRRLTAQVENVIQQIKEAKAEQEQAQQHLEETQQRKKSLEARLDELQKSLKELSDPSQADSVGTSNSDAAQSEASGEETSDTQQE